MEELQYINPSTQLFSKVVCYQFGILFISVHASCLEPRILPRFYEWARLRTQQPCHTHAHKHSHMHTSTHTSNLCTVKTLFFFLFFFGLCLLKISMLHVSSHITSCCEFSCYEAAVAGQQALFTSSLIMHDPSCSSSTLIRGGDRWPPDHGQSLWLGEPRVPDISRRWERNNSLDLIGTSRRV